MSKFKVAPNSVEAEQAVLGGLMINQNAWELISGILVSTDFYRSDHAIIFTAMSELADADSPIDYLTVNEKLKANSNIATNEMYTYLGIIAKNTPSSANIVHYAELIKESAVLRKLIQVGTEISDMGYSPNNRKAHQLIDDAEQRVFNIADRKDLTMQNGPVSLKKIFAATLPKIQELFESNSPITGVATGFTDFDKLTAGLQKSDFVIIAGRPSMGKTTFAMNIAESIGINSGLPVLIFSMEMPAEQLAMRLLASLGRIEMQRIRSGQLRDEDWPRISSAMAMVSDKKIYIDDSGSLSPHDVRNRARRIVKEHGTVGLIVIDYLQLMRVGGSIEHRAAEISEISRSLKSLARELNAPVIALSQLNRGLEQRTDKRPMMSDLRESGAIEQDADLIAFIYRDEVYHPDSPAKGTAEIIIGKQRNGPIGTVRLTFAGQYSRFENFSQSTAYALDHESQY